MLHVSETLAVPIKQQAVVANQARPAGADQGRRQPARSIFVAPTFTEMMLDIKKLEATLRAIAAGEDMIVPLSGDQEGGKFEVRVAEFKADGRRFHFSARQK